MKKTLKTCLTPEQKIIDKEKEYKRVRRALESHKSNLKEITKNGHMNDVIQYKETYVKLSKEMKKLSRDLKKLGYEDEI